MEANQNLLNADLHIDEIGHTHLRETARWVKFLGIMGIIISVFLAIAGIVFAMSANTLERYGGNSSLVEFSAGLIGAMYIIIAAIFFFMSLYLFLFGSKLKTALQTSDQQVFNEALLNQKRYYRIVGIITIVYVCLVSIVLLFGILAALFAAR